MTPTSRLLWLSLAAMVPVAASTFFPPLLWLALALLVLIAVSTARDVILSRRACDFVIHRKHQALLSIGKQNEITLEVENRGSYPLEFRVRDEAPDEFRVEPGILTGFVEPGKIVDLSYEVTPYRRGLYRFGDIVLRHRSALGLADLQVAIKAPEGMPVYPDILELPKHTLRIRGNEEVLQPVATRMGTTEFERLREYQPDDEFRYIDWNATARQGRPIVRQYQTQRNQNIILAFDLGRQMTSQYGELLKVDYAINSGVVLSWVGSERGENVGLLTFGDKVHTYLPPRSGRAHFRRILDQLYAAQPELVEPDYRLALTHLAAQNPKRSLVVIFTDIADRLEGEALVSSLSLLMPKYLPLVVLLMDPAIREASEIIPANGEDLYRLAVTQRLVETRTAAVQAMESKGVSVIDVPAEQLSVALLDTYLMLKSRAAI